MIIHSLNNLIQFKQKILKFNKDNQLQSLEVIIKNRLKQ